MSQVGLGLRSVSSWPIVSEAMYFQVKSGYTTPFARIHEFTGHGRILMFTAFPEFVISVKGHGWMITLYYLSIVFIALPIMVGFRVIDRIY